MTGTFTNLKTLMLGITIAMGLAVQCGQAKAQGTDAAVFAGGCFWCVEADFERVRGVGDAISGFTGGTTANPVYRRSGDHIEAVRIPFDPNAVSYATLVNLFFRSIDVFDDGGQFCDRGREYTTAIFVATPEQRRIAEAEKARAERKLGRDIVTPILDAGRFYPVDEYHQDYYRQTAVVLTRRGPKTKAEAYKFYRTACGRDARVREIWGSDAAFAAKS
ncbi:MAG: peptide-methionine (S)-S-oxide reductase MsrA [Paracoccaceae bacterium]|nr:peptide-methionine (S)-S-oxide reductase MsrA [Paracoccaceae bacterium]